MSSAFEGQRTIDSLIIDPRSTQSTPPGCGEALALARRLPIGTRHRKFRPTQPIRWSWWGSERLLARMRR
jgi:hypothetical protein